MKQEHLEPLEFPPETPLQSPFGLVHRIAYDEIDESLVTRAEMLTKRGSGASGEKY